MERHPFCDFAATLDDIKPGVPIAFVGVSTIPQFFCTKVVHLLPDADMHGNRWIQESSGYRTCLNYNGVLPLNQKHGGEQWSSKLTIVNTLENRRKIFDLLVETDTLVCLQSAESMTWWYKDEFGDELPALETRIRELDPKPRLVIVPI